MQAGTRNDMTYLHCPRIRFVPHRVRDQTLNQVLHNIRSAAPRSICKQGAVALENYAFGAEIQGTTTQCADELRG